MNKKDIAKLIERLQRLAEDHDQLSNIDPNEFLISEMREYRDDITDWISKLFNNIDYQTGVYLSGVPAPNRQGFIYSEQTGPQETRRMLKNLTCFDSRPGEKRIMNGEVSAPGAYPKYTEQDLHEASVGGMAVGTYVLPQDKADSEFNDVSDEVLTEQDRYENEYEVEEGDSDGVKGGIFAFEDDILEIAEVEDISIF